MTQTKERIRSSFEQLEHLPTLPEMAHKVLELRAKNEPDVNTLATAIELDPSLSAQVIRYARSTLYSYGGKLESVDHAIARVLGYDMVLNLALGLAAAKPFEIPDHGPLGARTFWLRAIETAVMAQTLASAMPKREGTNPSRAYLCGLLHEFGLLAIGHLYPDIYAKLNQTLVEEPDTDLWQLEQSLLGMTHAEAGAKVLRCWDLPEELVVAALKSPDPDYDGLHHEYANLVYLARQLIDCDPDQVDNLWDHVSTTILERTHLDQQLVAKAAAEFAANISEIESMARQFAA